jgi:23S rRNA (guanine745-N1)-methyltransferase
VRNVPISEFLDVLRCPVCAAPFEADRTALRCANGHAVDIARQGYVNLLSGSVAPGTADTAGMVAARAEFLASGHYAAIADAVAHMAGGRERGVVLDAGAGTGYYLSRVLDEVPGGRGLALDISKFAARRAARAHPRIAAAVCDTWRALPVRDRSVEVVLDVFAPRNGPEFARVLKPDGILIVVTPTARHLAELAEAVGLLSVDVRKQERLRRSLAADLESVHSDEHDVPLHLTTADVERLIRMGPSAWHVDAAEAARRAAALGEPFEATASVTVAGYRPRHRRVG